MSTKFSNKIQEEFIDALDRIKKFTGLELKLSEKVALRRIVCEIEKRMLITQRPENQVNTSPEAVHIFLDRYYDLPLPSQGELSSFLSLKRKINLERGYDAMSDFFKMKQDRAYLL